MAVELAAELRRAYRTPEGALLEKIMVFDREPAVRRACFDQRLRFARGEDERTAIAESVLADPDPALRLHAATFLGASGAETIEAIAVDRRVEEGVRIAALTAIGERHLRRLPRLVERLLHDSHASVRTAAIRRAGAHRLRGTLVRLDRLARRDDLLDEEEQIAIAEALAEIGDPAGETALLALLDQPRSAARAAAARGLGRIGTVAAVPKLTPLTEGLLPGELKGAAAAAVAAIQSRASGAEAGQLTVTDPAPADGALSLDNSQGALSAADRAGRAAATPIGTARKG